MSHGQAQQANARHRGRLSRHCHHVGPAARGSLAGEIALVRQEQRHVRGHAMPPCRPESEHGELAIGIVVPACLEERLALTLTQVQHRRDVLQMGGQKVRPQGHVLGRHSRRRLHHGSGLLRRLRVGGLGGCLEFLCLRVGRRLHTFFGGPIFLIPIKRLKPTWNGCGRHGAFLARLARRLAAPRRLLGTAATRSLHRRGQ